MLPFDKTFLLRSAGYSSLHMFINYSQRARAPRPYKSAYYHSIRMFINKSPPHGKPENLDIKA